LTIFIDHFDQLARLVRLDCAADLLLKIQAYPFPGHREGFVRTFPAGVGKSKLFRHFASICKPHVLRILSDGGYERLNLCHDVISHIVRDGPYAMCGARKVSRSTVERGILTKPHLPRFVTRFWWRMRLWRAGDEPPHNLFDLRPSVRFRLILTPVFRLGVILCFHGRRSAQLRVCSIHR